jgi:hypothetical protein
MAACPDNDINSRFSIRMKRGTMIEAVEQRVVIIIYLVAQLVEALLYKPEGSGYNSRWCHWNFTLT